MNKQLKSGLLVLIFSITMMIVLISSLTLRAEVVVSQEKRLGTMGISESRGVWLTNIDSDVLFTRERLKKSLKTLRKLNFNTVYPTVWNWGYTLYPSQIASRVIGKSLDPTPGLKNRDILKEITAQGHKQGLTVIPWFEFGFMAPADSLLAQARPEWITTRRDGTKIVKEGIHDRVWLNPFHPEVQKFMENLIVEIVKNYDIDGIQFDDHFGLPSELGYDPYTVGLYKQEHQGKAPSENFQDPEWVKWRADKITDLMKRVFFAIKANKKNCLVSVAPNPQRFSYEYYLADWQKWERMGLIEELVLQVYRDDLKVFISELEYPEVKAAQKHIPVSIGILTGLKNRSVPIEQIATQVEKTRDRNFAGVAFFFYETLWNMSQETVAKRQGSFQKLFPRTVQRNTRLPSRVSP